MRSLDATASSAARSSCCSTSPSSVCSGLRASSPTAARDAGCARGGARWGRSYRARLSLALFAFFVIPGSHSRSGRTASWRPTRSSRARCSSARHCGSVAAHAVALTRLARRERASRHAAPPVPRRRAFGRPATRSIDDLAPIGRFLPPNDRAHARRSRRRNRRRRRARRTAAPRCSAIASFATATLIDGGVAAPARAGDVPLGRRRRDLGVLVLFATALGALAALWLSGIAARAARPADRRAARSGALDRRRRANAAARVGAHGGIPPGVRGVPSHGGGPQREPHGARGSAAAHRGGAAQRGQRRRRRRYARRSRSRIRAPRRCSATSLAPGAPFDGAVRRPKSARRRSRLPGSRTATTQTSS